MVEVAYLSMWRPGHAARGSAPTRHPAGRAIDVARAKLNDGTVYNVHHHFHGKIGAQTCGAGAAAPRYDHAGARFFSLVS